MAHRTEYSYDDDVRDSLGLAHGVPRPLPWQQVAWHRVTVDPAPGDLTEDLDGYGNVVSYFHVTEPHRRLTIEAQSEVTVVAPEYDAAALAEPWERSRPLVHPDVPGAWAATEFVLESPRAKHVDEAHDYARASLLPGRPIGEAVTDLMHRIKADFQYDSKATTVTSTVADVMATRAGVCQDFAHLALACLRTHGVAARYVSGYLATRPLPGRERVVGADASHAWVAAWIPGPGRSGSGQWLAFDPTNDQWIADRHVTVAWGRDYGDVSPVKGIIFTEAKKSTLRVSVDVAPLEEYAQP
ncbi:transglutaminase family protein [Microbacterium rhizomatis]|uniref:transglutaminase family protein n=1 Tax=Microbacterium rhizomatis TaxID=1631477 RepID=UPI001FEC1093|nr:transglutaminase family protein [Microbacterium rhizomatis]